MLSIKLPLIILASILLASTCPASNPETSGKTTSEPEAPPPPAPKPSTAVLMAQMCVSEISWQKDIRECQLMMEVNYRNAERNNLTPAKQTRRFNAYFKKPNKNRKWIQYLNNEGTEPHFWPKDAASWKVHRKYWMAYLNLAKAFPRKFKHQWYPALCERADDYGGRCDDNGLHACDTPKQECARLIRCLTIYTHQDYWNLECCRNRAKCKGRFKSKDI